MPVAPSPSPPWRIVGRSLLMAQLRQFFWREGFIEVDTPIAIRAPAPEWAIEAVPVAICADDFAQARAERRFLQTSPELAMKRLLAQGLSPIFQVAPAFRDGDRSQVHAPEFRLLEWYRAHAPYTDLMIDCEALIGALAAAAVPLWRQAQQDTGDTKAASPLPRGLNVLQAQAPWPRLTVDACLRAHAGFGLADVPDAQAFATALTAIGVHVDAEDSWDELFFRAMVDRVEPALAQLPTPVFVTEFPASQAALARLHPQRPEVAERFELYACGLELANAFGELTDADGQRQRFVATRALRALAGKRDYPLDETFLTALQRMPEASGIALGIERLLMLLLDADHIDQVSCIPWLEA